MSLFGTDGIRTKAFQGPLSLDNLFKIGQGMAAFLKQQTTNHRPSVLIGRDPRFSGPLLQTQLCSGLLAQGIHVIDAGMLPTPVISVLTQHYKADLGVIISASHNPAPDNGVKIIDRNGKKLAPELEQELEKLILNPPQEFPGNGQIHTFAGATPYLEFIQKKFQLPYFKVILDCANGAFSEIAPSLLKGLGLEVITQSQEPNGYNINENCGALYPEKISQKVIEEKADLGISLDGDGDRAILVDEKGQIQDGDKLLAMLAIHLKSKSELVHHTVVSTIMSNFGLKQCFKSHDIQLLQTPVGDRHISVKLQEEGYSLGGEPSGHLIFSDHPTQSGDGLFTGLKILELMAYTQKKLSDLGTQMKTFPQILHNVIVKEKIPLEELPEFQAALNETEKNLAEQGRVVVRYSGTENLLRIMVEGAEHAMISREADRLKEIATIRLSPN